MSPLTRHKQDDKESISSSTVNLRKKLLNKSELKTSIPKPSPMQSRLSIRAKSSSSCQSQPLSESKIPVSMYRSLERGQTSASLRARPRSTTSGKEQKTIPVVNQPQTSRPNLSSIPKPIKPNIRPQSASASKNQGTNVKDVLNSPKTTRQFSPLNVSGVAAPCTRSINNIKNETSAMKKTQNIGSEEKKLCNEELIEKQRQILNIFSELRKLQSPKDLQPLEVEICKLMQNKTLEHIESISKENTSLKATNECSSDFLMVFENQMQQVTESWLHLLCDVISNKMVVGNSVRISLPETSLNVRDEVMKLLMYFPTEGEALNTKLQKIEKEHIKGMAVLTHNAMALCKQYDDLKDRYFRLEKTQDQVNFELKEQVAILGEENQELDRKHEKAVEMYNMERIKTEQLEKYKITINKELLEVKKINKIMEGRCLECEIKTKKADATCRALEVSTRNKDIVFEKESKSHRELCTKLNESKETNNCMKSDLEESNKALVLLESSNKDLKEELSSKTAAMEELEEKRNMLAEELSVKSKKLSETLNEINLIKAYIKNGIPVANYPLDIADAPDITSNVLVEDLTKDVHLRMLQVQELKKKVNNMEYLLKEKTTREEMLTRQLSALQKQPHETEGSLNVQIQNLQYELSDVAAEKAELEKIIAQKTLELDQRDLLMQDHSQVIQAKDELIPMIQNNQLKENGYVEKLNAIVIEQQKTCYYHLDENEYSESEPNLLEMMKALEKHFVTDPKMVNRELSFRQEKMSELFNLVEHKQMEIMRLERRLREFQGIKEEKEQMEKEKEAYIFSLQRELEDRKVGKSRGLFSMFYT